MSRFNQKAGKWLDGDGFVSHFHRRIQSITQKIPLLACMLFNSAEFAIFLSIVLSGYYILRASLRAQNIWLLASSYFFYGWWDWRFLSLLAGATVVAYGCANAISRATSGFLKRFWLLTALLINLGVLGFFKYFNFFQENTIKLLNALGVDVAPILLELVLPIGISFFAFQGLSYVIDVYRCEAVPARSFLEFAVFKAFFPQLVAGPIERANHMLPQIYNQRRTTAFQVISGTQLLIWGLFKKTVIADNLAVVANSAFNGYTTQAGADLLIGMVAFTFQIYCDFSGYSDIARGVGRLFGFELVVNFVRPYFSVSPSTFWKRWHISLSQWLRDYVYISMGGNRLGHLLTIRNLLVTMLLGGLWHGAAWNFVAWGAYHGALLSIYRILDLLTESVFGHFKSLMAKLTLPFRWALMFILTVIGWVFFRSGSLSQVSYMLTHIGFDTSIYTADNLRVLLVCAMPLMLIEAFAEFNPYLFRWRYWKLVPLAFVSATLVCLMLIFTPREPVEFIYFDF